MNINLTPSMCYRRNGQANMTHEKALALQAEIQRVNFRFRSVVRELDGDWQLTIHSYIITRIDLETLEPLIKGHCMYIGLYLSEIEPIQPCINVF